MTKRAPLLHIVSIGALTLVSVVFASRPAFAQETPPPEPATVSRGGSRGGGGAGLGFGGAAFVSGLTGAEVDYDQAVWDIEGLLAFSNTQVGGGMNPPRQTTFDIGVSGWYHFNVGVNSDFSLGGGVGIVTASVSSGGGSLTAVIFEPGFRVRAFVTPNVAVFGRVGLPLIFGDDVNGVTGNTSIALANQLTGGFGFTYYLR